MCAADRNPVAASTRATGLSSLDWLICAVVALGFLFDTFEIIVMPVTVRPALISLGVAPGTPVFSWWVGTLLYAPAGIAGLFGIAGGYLIDRYGRRRIVVFSLLLYGASTLGGAAATSPAGLLAARCVTLIGVSLEFIAAITWLAELFPEPERRERVLGYSQIASGVGNFAVTGTYYAAVTFAAQLPALNGHHDAWRYTLAAGFIPSIPLLLVRPWLPESPLWKLARTQSELRRPGPRLLLAPALRHVTIVSTLLTACVYASAYGVLQQAPRLVPALPDVRALPSLRQEQLVSTVHFFGSLGEVAGRLLLALLVVHVVSQRRLLRLFMIPALIVVPIGFVYASTAGVAALKAASFIGTLLVIAQFSFLGNYLPRLFPTALRGMGESLAVNIGGRVLGTSAAFMTPQLVGLVPDTDPARQLAIAMAITAVSVLGLGAVLTAWMPEPASQRLPDTVEQPQTT